MIANDIHSQLNFTEVEQILRPKSTEDLINIVKAAKKDGKKISISGGKHAMGGQQFGVGTILLDMRDMSQVLNFDQQVGLIEIEAGIEWPELIDFLKNAQKDNKEGWAIIQKQTGADKLTIGGSLSANIHGRGLKIKPIINDIESFTLVDSEGSIKNCSRNENYELFKLVIGGYGLFGIIATVKLKLTHKEVLQRIVEIIDVDQLMELFEKRINEGFLYGDFQFNTDSASDIFLRKGVFSCYKPVPSSTPQSASYKEISDQEWVRLYALGHTDHKKAYEFYTQYYLSTSGQVYDSDTHQLSYYPENYHLEVDKLLGGKKGSEMITEIDVPRDKISWFLTEAGKYFKQNGVEVFYGTVRLIEKDDESFLAWAKQPYICTIFNLHVDHTPEGLSKAEDAFRHLIDLAIEQDGSYYLTYHKWATKEQVEKCYPQFSEFLELKKKYDPAELFQSEWYRHYRKMFSSS